MMLSLVKTLTSIFGISFLFWASWFWVFRVMFPPSRSRSYVVQDRETGENYVISGKDIEMGEEQVQRVIA